MKEVLAPEMTRFFSAIRDDCRIGPVHISLFMAIMQYWELKGCQHPLSVFSYELMRLAKISGAATFHKGIKELCAYGYIHYEPSYNHNIGSLIFIPK